MTADTNQPVHLKASTPAELVAILPYLFGFTPSESVIVLALRDRRVKAAARVDAEAIDHPDDIAGRLQAVAVQGDLVVVVIWMSSVPEAERAARAMTDLLDGADQVIVVDADQCRADDGPWTRWQTDVPEARLAGLEVLSDRAALAAQVQGPPDGDKSVCGRWLAAQEAMGRHDQHWCHQRAGTLLQRGLDDVAWLSGDELVELAALMREGDVRDGVWPYMTQEQARQQLALWRAVVAAVPQQGAVAPLGLLAMAAWLSGEGALQTCCLERGRSIDPEHSLIRLGETINAMAVSPDRWSQIQGVH